jgi:hypothetical protein
MSKVLFESDYGLLTYIKAEKILKLEWLKSCSENEYEQIFNKAVSIASLNKVQFFLSDIRNGGPVTYKNLIWMKKNIIPKAVELEIQKVALIFDGSLNSKIYADLIRVGLDKSRIAINYFKSEEEAISWFQF